MPHTSTCVRVEVVYGLREYLGVIDEFVPLSDAGRGSSAAGWISRLFDSKPVRRLCLYVLVPPIFLFKKLRMGRCTFEFSGIELRRTTRGRTASREWTKVTCVHRLSQAYMIELQEGCLPVPYRAFSDAQRREFEALVPGGLLVERAA